MSRRIQGATITMPYNEYENIIRELDDLREFVKGIYFQYKEIKDLSYLTSYCESINHTYGIWI